MTPHDSGEAFAIRISQVLSGLSLFCLVVATGGLWLRYRAAVWIGGVALAGLVVFTAIMVLVFGFKEVVRPVIDRPTLLLDGRSLVLLSVTLAGPKVPLWPLIWSSSAFLLLKRLHLQESGAAPASPSENVESPG